jgi:hypothetical protein
MDALSAFNFYVHRAITRLTDGQIKCIITKKPIFAAFEASFDLLKKQIYGGQNNDEENHCSRACGTAQLCNADRLRRQNARGH